MWWLLGKTGLEGGGFGSRRGRASFSAIGETEGEGERLLSLRRVRWPDSLGLCGSNQFAATKKDLFEREKERIFGSLIFSINQLVCF